MDANGISKKLQEKGFTIDIQENQVYAFIEPEVRVSDIYILLEGQIPFAKIEKIGKGTYKISAEGLRER